MRYRKKPVEIEAVRFEKPYVRVKEFCRQIQWIKGQQGEIVWAVIPTLEGKMRAEPGDWIIRGVQGEFYPCRDDIFRQTYEPKPTVEMVLSTFPAIADHKIERYVADQLRKAGLLREDA